jgi:hypothetical protein
MKTAIQTDYHTTIVVNASPLQATEAINQVKLWWTENTEGSTNTPNDLFKVTFGETFSRFKITEIIPGEKINWLVLDCNLHWMNNKKEWKDTNILWKISSFNNSTRIDMTHVGLGPGIECFEDCTKGWNHYVKESLYKLITEGKGVPDHKDHSARYRQ